VLAIGCLELGLATHREVLGYFALGTLGGILPDIDADYSVPVQILFSALAVFLAFLAVFRQAGTYSIAELALLGIAVYFLVRHVAGRLFARFTEHRGVFHSLLAAVFFGLLTTAMAYHLFRLSPFAAWLTGCFVGVGYGIHLTLDELYSVDLVGATLKRSFGTALKPASWRNLKASICMGVATLVLFWFAMPRADAFLHALGNWRTYKAIQHKLLPKDRWFKLP
jgi:hypothetical protein